MNKQKIMLTGALLLAPLASALAAGQTLSFQQGLNGYTGTQELFDQIVNELIGYKQDHSEVGYKYM